MSARLFNMSAVQVSPVLWRQKISVGLKPIEPKQDQPMADMEEVQTLRRRIADLTSASDQNSRQAYDAGRQAGEAAAREVLEAEVRVTTERLAQTIAGLAATRGEALRRAEGDTVKLAIEIARRVLHRELSVDSSAIEALVKAALEKLQSQEIHRVKVHPDQEKLLRACLEQAGRCQGIEVVGDPSQLKGAAFFELTRGSLDASVETQLREIERGLADELQVRR
jgi:flagellar assembly protein FliH